MKKELPSAIEHANQDYDWEVLNLQNNMRHDWAKGGREGNLIKISNLVGKMILEKNQSEFLNGGR